MAREKLANWEPLKWRNLQGFSSKREVISSWFRRAHLEPPMCMPNRMLHEASERMPNSRPQKVSEQTSGYAPNGMPYRMPKGLQDRRLTENVSMYVSLVPNEMLHRMSGRMPNCKLKCKQKCQKFISVHMLQRCCIGNQNLKFQM